MLWTVEIRPPQCSVKRNGTLNYPPWSGNCCLFNLFRKWKSWFSMFCFFCYFYIGWQFVSVWEMVPTTALLRYVFLWNISVPEMDMTSSGEIVSPLTHFTNYWCVTLFRITAIKLKDFFFHYRSISCVSLFVLSLRPFGWVTKGGKKCWMWITITCMSHKPAFKLMHIILICFAFECALGVYNRTHSEFLHCECVFFRTCNYSGRVYKPITLSTLCL